VPFAPIPDEVVVARLEAAGRTPEEARLAAALAGGSLGRALALDAEELDEVRDAVAAAAELDPDDALAWLAFARAHGEDREVAGEICALLALWLRDVLAQQAAGDGARGPSVRPERSAAEGRAESKGDPRLALADLAAATRRAAAALSPAEVLRRRAEVERTRAALRQNASPVLALEGLLIGWFHGEPQV